MSAPVFFAGAAAFRHWLEVHADRETELWVGYHRVGTGRPSLTWSESVDEALCFGWIDGIRKRVDETSYKIRFTPRKSSSNWSAVNIAKAESLISQGLMQPAGLAAFERRREEKHRVYSYEQDATEVLTAPELRLFRSDQAAWEYFTAAPPGYRRTVLHWVASPKREETRARRLAKLVAACAEGLRLF